MSPKKRPKDRHKRRKITLELKHKIIEERERGVSVADLARSYNRSTSTICTILKDKDKIKEVNASKGVTRISSARRLRILNDVEKLLLSWIKEKQLQGDSVTERIICEKAKEIFVDFVKKTPGSSTTKNAFKGSRGWFEKFRRRTGIVLRHCETTSFETYAAENFIGDFKKLVHFEGYQPQQVFNCAEAGLYWKKMPKRVCIAEEDDHKPMRDRLTLLLCANASGDLKIKPLLVYDSETPKAFKKCKIQKSELNVMWRSNYTASVTHEPFTDWSNEVFAPSVNKYLLEMNLPLHVLLIMDNSPVYPPDLQDHLLEEFKFIKILFLPPNTTPLLQPMNQQVISNFRKFYTIALFERCFEVTELTNLTLKDFWTHHFHIAACLKIIENAWEGVTKRTLTHAWKKLWPESVVKCEFEESETELEDLLVYEIVSLAKSMGLEVDSNDINELVEEHNKERTTEERLELHCPSHQEIKEESFFEEEVEDVTEKQHNQELTTEELSESHCASQQEIKDESLSEEEGEELVEKQQSSREIREMLKAWENVASYIEKHHPDKTKAMRAINSFGENAVSYFRRILNCQQK